MRNVEAWQPTKFVQSGSGDWRPTRDVSKLAASSRLYAGRAAAHYQRALKVHARGDLADLGCGLVPLYGVYRDLVATVTCVDWAESVHDTLHLDHAIDLSGPFDELAENSFDTVLMTDVLEHLPEPDFALSEVTRVMRPGGTLILGVPFMYVVHEAPHDYYRYTQFLLRRLLERHGHEVLELRFFGGPVDVVFDVIGKSMGAVGAPTSLVAAEQALANVVARRLPVSLREKGDQLMPLGHMVVSRLT